MQKTNNQTNQKHQSQNQFNQMNQKNQSSDNFKETEIGKIPVDWEVKSIGDSFIFKNGLNKEKKFFGYGFPIVNYMDVYRNSGIYNNDIQGKVFLNSTELKSFEVKKGDVLFTRTSETPEEIGLSAVILDEVFKTTFSGFLLRARPTNDLFDLNFCKYCFDNNTVRIQIKSKSTYTTRALTNGRVLSNIQIPLPPLAEQEKIAEVLSDTDLWIESTEALLAKKRQIKKGAMQKLLSPKQDWEVKKLGDLGFTYVGLSGKNKDDFGIGNAFYIPFINIIYNTKIDITNFEKINISIGESQNKTAKGDIFFNTSSETPEEVGMSSILLDDVENLYLNSFCFGFRFKHNANVDGLFFSYLMRSEYGRKEIFALAQGATRYNLPRSKFLELILKFPPLKTQQEIAEILSSMDLEIESLENRLQKARQIKQGMMQDLLTGKVRLG